MGVGSQRHAPAALLPEVTRYLLVPAADLVGCGKSRLHRFPTIYAWKSGGRFAGVSLKSK